MVSHKQDTEGTEGNVMRSSSTLALMSPRMYTCRVYARMWNIQCKVLLLKADSETCKSDYTEVFTGMKWVLGSTCF